MPDPTFREALDAMGCRCCRYDLHEERARIEALYDQVVQERDALQDKVTTLEHLRTEEYDELAALREKLRSCVCTYCGWSVQYGDTSDGEVARVRDIMRDHDSRCQRNPLIGEIAALRAERDALVPLARWLAEYVADGLVDLDGEVPPHDCDYASNPEAGYCEFHDKWVTLCALLAARKEGTP